MVPQGGATEPPDDSLILVAALELEEKSEPRYLWECEAKHMYTEISARIGLVEKTLSEIVFN